MPQRGIDFTGKTEGNAHNFSVRETKEEGFADMDRPEPHICAMKLGALTLMSGTAMAVCLAMVYIFTRT